MGRMRTLGIVILGCIVFVQCRPRNESEFKAAANENTNTVFDYRVAGPNLPPSGRSLFDKLFADPGFEGEAKKVRVPYPFSKIIERINASGYPVAGVMIPKGRSLQRNAAKPDFFKFPRVVVTALPAEEKSPAVRVTSLSGKLFIGFVEPAKQLEIISFNDELGRFEFQVVRDYGPNTVPQVFYAERSLCLACHQSQAPIFSIGPWRETNANPAIRKLISSARRNENSYQGIPIDMAAPGTAAAFFDPAAAVDRMVRLANDIVLEQSIWNEGCGRNVESAVTCRTALLKGSFASIPAATYHSTEQEIRSNVKTFYPAELLSSAGFPQLPTSAFSSIISIPTPDPLTIPDDVLEQVRLAVLRLKDVDSISPLIQRNFVNSDSTGDDFQSKFSNSYEEDNPFSGFKTENVRAAIDAFATAETQSPHGLLSGKYQRGTVIAAIAKELGANVAPSYLGQDDSMRIERAQTEPAPSNAGEGSDLRLAPFRRFCSRCHVNAPLPTFMAGTDEEVLTKLKAGASEHLNRLDWDSSTSSSVMPPKTSEEYKLLSQPGHEAERAAMLVFLTQLQN